MALWEEEGPDANYVREFMYKKIYRQYFMLPELYINRVLLTHISDENSQSFGSWRGWITFGIATHIGKAIVVDLDKGLQAINKLKQLLYYHLQHCLYKPGGIRMQNIQKETLIGKPLAHINIDKLLCDKMNHNH
jgi:hypothetical protein